MKLCDPGARGSGECQCQDVPGERNQQKAAVLTLMGGSLLKEEGSCVQSDFPSRCFLLLLGPLATIRYSSSAWRQQVWLRSELCPGTGC